MSNTFKKVISLTMVILLAIAFITGCAGTEADKKTDDGSASKPADTSGANKSADKSEDSNFNAEGLPNCK